MTDLERLEVIEKLTELLVALVLLDCEGDTERNDQGKIELIKPGELKLVLN